MKSWAAAADDEMLQTIMGSGSALIRKNFEGSNDDDNAARAWFPRCSS